VDWRLSAGWSLDAGLVYTDGVSRYDDGPGRDTRSAVRTSVARLGVTGQLTPGWKTQLRYGQSQDTSNAIVAATLPSHFKTTQDQWTWQNDVSTTLGTLVAGLDYLQQRVDSSTLYAVRERSISSVFAGLNGAAGAHSWQASVRRDDNSQFGANTTGTIGYGFEITPAWRVHASHGTSFVAPSFNQLYFPGFGTATLRPERGRNTDLGVSWSAGGQTAKLVYFRNDIRDLIASPAPTFLPVNVDRAQITGWTLGYETRLGAWALRANLDLIDPVNEATGLQLIRRAREQATLGADYTAGAWQLGASILAAGRRYENAANTVVTAGYATVDAYANYRVARDWSLQLKLNNLADKDYETVRGYNQPGRAAYVTLRWQPQ
jgi:vitamin B12 transporter